MSSQQRVTRDTGPPVEDVRQVPVPGPSGDAGQVTVRYWAGARQAAGVAQDEVAPGTVGDVLGAVVSARPALAEVLPICSLLLDGRVVERSRRVEPGAVLEVLPPFAGG